MVMQTHGRPHPTPSEPRVRPVEIRPPPAPLPALDATPVSLTASEGMRPPCHCLLDASPGEALNLIAYDSFPADSITPYRGTGPVFVYAHNRGDVLPERQLRRLLSVRAYDEKHMMVSAEVVGGSELEGEIAGGC